MALKSLPPPQKLCPNILLNLSGQHGEPSFAFSSLPDNTSFVFIIAPLRCDLTVFSLLIFTTHSLNKTRWLIYNSSRLLHWAYSSQCWLLYWITQHHLPPSPMLFPPCSLWSCLSWSPLHVCSLPVSFADPSHLSPPVGHLLVIHSIQLLEIVHFDCWKKDQPSPTSSHQNALSVGNICWSLPNPYFSFATTPDQIAIISCPFCCDNHSNLLQSFCFCLSLANHSPHRS